MHPALHSKMKMKPSYPQAYESTVAQRKHIKQTLRRLRKSDYAENERNAIAKNDTNNAKSEAIDSARAKRNQPTIELAQRSQNATYRLSSAFNQTIKR
jgi:hypothetical protein